MFTWILGAGESRQKRWGFVFSNTTQKVALVVHTMETKENTNI
jgi:hypothetical protein